MSTRPTETLAESISFEDFWNWLSAHRHCILRAGTGDVLIFDHDEYHWYMFIDKNGAHVVQLVRGKLLVAEMVVLGGDIVYVFAQSNAHDEHVFDCMVETPGGTEIAYHFVLAHAFESEGSDEAPRLTH